MAFDKTLSFDDLKIKADNAEEVKLGDFIANYSHNDSDYKNDELIDKIVKYYTDLHDNDFPNLHKHCQTFCELFEGNEGKVFANDILGEITYASEKIQYATVIKLNPEFCAD